MGISLTEDQMDRRVDFIIGMNKEDVAERMNFVGASDANIILGGDQDKIYQLWQEKCGLVPPVDLSDILPVQMGTWTEDLNLMWFEKKTGQRVTHRKAKVIHPEIPYIRASLDGKVLHPEIDGLMCVVDAKHVNPFNYSAENCLKKYAPQLAVQMACTDEDYALLSIFSGIFTWEWIGMKRDPFYEAEVLAACRLFWAAVQDRTPPVEIKSAELSMPVAMMRKIDLSLSNIWISAETDYLTNEEANVKYEMAKKTMKSLVEADVGEVKGRELCAKRSKDGSIRFSKIKGKK
jgi:hypothetical protein